MLKFFLSLVLLIPSLSYGVETYYIRPKAYLDVESGKMVYGKIIGIADGLIKSIGNKAPADKEVVNFEKLFLLPGLFDCHTHIFLTQTVEDKSFENALMREAKNTDDMRTERARKFLKQYLNEGFTSVCDLGNSGKFLDVKLRNKIDGLASYPDLFISGQGVTSYKGQFAPGADMASVENEYLIVNDKTDIDLVLNDYLKKKVDILKIYLDNSPGTTPMDPSILKRIIDSPLVKKFKKVTFHAIDKNSITPLMGLSKISIEHGINMDWGSVDKKNIYLTLTDLSQETLKEFNDFNSVSYLAQVARAKSAYAKGIKLVFGTDFYFHKDTKDFDRGKYAKNSVVAWKEDGISSIDVLKAMTINAAESLGMEKKIGVIKVGAMANLIGVSEDPLINLKSLDQVGLVINKGEIVKRPDLDKLQKKL